MNDTYNETLDWLKINDIPFDELIYLFDNVYNMENKEYNRIYSFNDLYYNICKLS